MMSQETIAAIATPPGYGGVGVLRISGTQTKLIAEKILGRLPKPRQAAYGPFLDQKNAVIDQGIALFFPAPHSFTGEDVLELQGHGGPIVLDCLLRRVLSIGARMARPGEFSERAFLNGKIDLAQAEAIADLISAGSEQAARSALKSLQGEFSNRIQMIVSELIQLRIYVEAAIDFPTEEIDFIEESTVHEQLKSLINSIEKLRQSAHQGALLQEGMNAVIIGKPNAGKSSLLNKLSGKDSAIVTDVPGTTRDILKEIIHVDGLPLHLVDTAGLRETEDIVELEGIRRTYEAIKKSDVVLWISDASQKPLEKWSEPEDHLNFLSRHLDKTVPILIIRNKIDLISESPSLVKTDLAVIISISAKFNQGIDLLKEQLKKVMGFSSHCEDVFIARRRHLTAIDQSLFHLKQGLHQLSVHRSSELLAEDLRQAQHALNEITGEFSADDLLGKIFSNFCIGK